MKQQATKPKPEKHNLTCHHCQKPGHYRNQSRQLKREDWGEANKNSAGNITITATVVERTLTLTTQAPNVARITTQTIEMTANPKLSTHLVRPVVKITTPQRNAFLEPMQQTNPSAIDFTFPETE